MARTLHDELLYGDRPARSAPQSVEERRQQLGNGVGVAAGERPLFAFDCDEREARITLLGVPAPTTHNAAERTATDYSQQPALRPMTLLLPSTPLLPL